MIYLFFWDVNCIIAWLLKVGVIDCPETLLFNYQLMLNNMPQEQDLIYAVV
jgi:hypothetical protein